MDCYPSAASLLKPNSAMAHWRAARHIAILADDEIMKMGWR